MSFEETLQQNIFSQNREKTYIDKLLAKEDTERLRDLMRKTEWERSDLLEALFIIGATEAKLLNYGEWDRYITLKFFVWLREFVKVGELLYDYTDDLKKNKSKISERTTQVLYNNQRLIEHNIKFLIDLYLNIGHTTLSLGGTGILELLKNKYEMSYPQQPGIVTPTTQATQAGWWQKVKGG